MTTIDKLLDIDKLLYTAKVHTTGGRDGASRSSDGNLDFKLSTPGTAHPGTNPEQLFAAGWSACFMSAVALLAAQRKISLPADRYIDAEVDLGTNEEGFIPLPGSTSTCPAWTARLPSPWWTRRTKTRARTPKLPAATST